MDFISDDTILSAVLPISYGGEDSIYLRRRRSSGSASLSQSAIRFHLGQIWATTLSFPLSIRPQVAEGRRGYAGSNKAFSVERDSVGKEQLLEPLALFERRLHPQVGGARQNAFCERQDALYVEFIELA